MNVLRLAAEPLCIQHSAFALQKLWNETKRNCVTPPIQLRCQIEFVWTSKDIKGHESHNKFRLGSQFIQSNKLKQHLTAIHSISRAASTCNGIALR